MTSQYDTKTVKVVGLVTFGGDINKPSAEPWFHIVVYFNNGFGEYDVITQDATSFRYLYDNADDGTFSPKHSLSIKKAIKRYVTGLLCDGVVNTKRKRRVTC